MKVNPNIIQINDLLVLCLFPIHQFVAIYFGTERPLTTVFVMQVVIITTVMKLDVAVGKGLTSHVATAAASS